MANRRVGGILSLTVNGIVVNAKGAYAYNLGVPMREGVAGHDAVHGYKELPRVPFIEGVITDTSDLNVADLQSTKDATIVLILANGKKVVLQEAWWAGEGDVSTEEGEIGARFEGMRCEELPA